MDWFLDVSLTFGILVMALLLALAVFLAFCEAKDEDNWQEFVKKNGLKLVSQDDDEHYLMPTVVGKIVMAMPMTRPGRRHYVDPTGKKYTRD